MSKTNPPKALLTDVFGTVVDWRTTVSNYLSDSASESLNSASNSLASMVRLAAAAISWPAFADEWRASYYQFTRSYDPDTMDFKPIDQHHLESLIALVRKYDIEGLWSVEQLERISLIWHFLEPWPDSSPGIAALSKNLRVSTFSNGSTLLLHDLASHGDLAYTDFISAADFKAYKPHPTVYLGACAKLSLQPSECAVVAAHLSDLKAAHSHGIQTIYVERPHEEAWEASKVEEAKQWVDMWIGIDEGGFEEIARRLNVV